MEERTVSIPAISCMHCVMTIKRELQALEGVTDVDGDQVTKQVTIRWQPPATWNMIVATLNEIGYPPER